MTDRNDYGEGIVGGYIPVINQAYSNFISWEIEANPDYSIGIFDETIVRQLPHLRKDIRALDPALAEAYMNVFRPTPVFLLGHAALSEEIEKDFHFSLPDDEVTDYVVDKYDLRNVTTSPVFMRWDRKKSIANKSVYADRIIPIDNLPHWIVESLQKEQSVSTDWWRQVGAVFTHDKSRAFTAHNQHNPTAYSPSIDGDPRMNANRGSGRELTTVIHAEASALIQAARAGVSTEGGSIFATTFPCPDCAKLIAHAGIKTVYFMEGYAMVDGYNILKSHDIDVIEVEGYEDTIDPARNTPYPERPTS